MRNKLLVVFMLVVTLGVTGCEGSSSLSLTQEEKELRYEILNGRDALLKFQNYIIANNYYGQQDTTSLIVRAGDNQYIEYPISSDGAVEVRDFSEGGSYGLSEYRLTDGTWISFTDSEMYRLPKGYSSYRDDLRVMYIDRLLEHAHDFKRGDDYTTHTVTGHETFHTIYFTADEYAVRDTLGNPEYGSYMSAIDVVSDKSAKRYAEWVSEDLSDTFKCASVECVAMLDASGVLRGVAILGKGGGSQLYNTAVVVNLNNDVVRAEPDISSSNSFVNYLVQAGFATSEADSYKEAVNMLLEFQNSGGEAVDEEETD